MLTGFELITLGREASDVTSRPDARVQYHKTFLSNFATDLSNFPTQKALEEISDNFTDVKSNLLGNLAILC